MKLLTSTITATILLLGTACFGATPEEEAKFLNAVRTAITTKDKDALNSLSCLDGVTEEFKAMNLKSIEYLFAQPINFIEYCPAEPDDSKEPTRNGVVYALNLKIIKRLKIEFQDDPERVDQKTRIYKLVGEKDGRLMFASYAPKS